MSQLDALCRCSLLSQVPEEILQTHLLPLCRTREVSRGCCLIAPQERLEQIGVVIHGKIQILHLFPDGNSCMVDVLKEGDAFGLELLFTHSRIAPYHAIAADQSALVEFPAEALLSSGSLPDSARLSIYRQALAHISQNSMRREYRLAILAQKGLRNRILTYLTMQANRRGTTSFSIPFSREELADFLCVNRSALSHELSLMQQEGLITCRKNQFTLL